MKAIYLALTLITLTACGGGGGGSGSLVEAFDASANAGSSARNENPSDSGLNRNNDGCSATWSDVLEYGFVCDPPDDPSIPPIDTGIQPDPEPRNRSANIGGFSEFEPNNSLANANIVELPAVSGDLVAGVRITGSVHDTEDASDFFTFVPDRSGTYLIYLCEEVCTEQPTDNQVAIRVYDQNGELMVANPLFEESTKFLQAHFDAGLLYYVEILGFDTAMENYPYLLVIIE